MTKDRWRLGAGRAALVLGALAGFLCASGGQGAPPETQKLILENEFVRVYDIRVPPGVLEEKHSHLHGITIGLSDYNNETKSFPDGKVSKTQARFGDVKWTEAVTHEARNTGTTLQHVIRIELKDTVPSGKTDPPSPLDSLVACKDTQKLIFENRFARAIDDRMGPGVAEPKHKHLHGLTITLADWDSEMVSYPSGEKAQRHAAFGAVAWTEPLVHDVRNSGKTEGHTIRIELK